VKLPTLTGDAMKKKKAPRKARSKRSVRKTPTTAKTSSQKRVRSAGKKKVITDSKATVLSKLKNVFDDTTAKLKKLLPNEPESSAKEPADSKAKETV
jgi:hypothetical protein